MTNALPASSGGNPFTAQNIRPGAIPFLFPNHVAAEQLVDRLPALGWRAAIEGQHGSGKSTLLRTLEPLLVRAGRKLLWCELHDGERRLPIRVSRANADDRTLIVVDGYEQLSWWSKRRLRIACWRLGSGLLVTAHDAVGLPVLWSTQTDPSLALEVARSLESLTPGAVPVAEAEVRRAFTLHGGNIRETLFALYDLYRQQRHPPAS